MVIVRETPRDCLIYGEHYLVSKTPQPFFTLTQWFYDRVICGLVMLGGVLVLGVITAADMAAGHTKAQVDPRIAHCQALFAAIRTWNDFLDLIAVGANFLILPAAPNLFAKRFPRW